MAFTDPTHKIIFQTSFFGILLLVGALFVFHAPFAHAKVEISDGSVKALYHFNSLGNASDTVGTYDLTGGQTVDSTSPFVANLNDADWANLNNHNVYTSSSFDYNGYASATIGVWMKATTSSGVMFLDDNANFGMQIVNNTKIRCGVVAGGVGTDMDTDGQFQSNVPVFLSCEYAASDGVLRFFVNGVQQNSHSGLSGNIRSLAGKYYVGNYQSAYHLPGQLDEAFIVGKELTTSTLLDIYKGGNGSEICITAGCGGISLSSLNQYKSDATTTIAEGGKTTESTVVFGAKLQSSGTSTLQLQVEVEPVSTSFINTANVTSSFVSPGSSTTATKMNLVPGSYHWQARVLENGTNATSTWQLFGPTSTSTDFIVDPADSVYFNGSSSWRWPATKLGLNSSDPLTIEFYYKTTSTSSAMQLLDTRTNGTNGFALWKDAGDGGAINFSLDCGGDATGTTVQLTGARGIHNAEAEGYWHHVAVSKKSTASSTDAFKLYFDGVQQTGGQCYTSTSTDSIWVPGNPSSSMSLFKGNMDELRIWKTERSVSDIAAYSLAEVTSTDSNLLGYWRFNATSTDLVTGNATSGQSGSPIFSTSTPFGHFIFRDDPSIRPWTSVNTSTYGLLWYNSSTQYLAQWVAGANTWNASTSHAINIASTTATSSANLIVDDVNLPSSGFLARWNNLVGPPQEIQYNTPNLVGYSSTTLQHISTHELGHALGLAHSLFGDIMYAYSDPTTLQTTLGLQDKNDYEFLWAH